MLAELDRGQLLREGGVYDGIVATYEVLVALKMMECLPRSRRQEIAQAREEN